MKEEGGLICYKKISRWAVRVGNICRGLKQGVLQMVGGLRGWINNIVSSLYTVYYGIFMYTTV